MEPGHQFCALHVLLCFSHYILLEQVDVQVSSRTLLFYS